MRTSGAGHRFLWPALFCATLAVAQQSQNPSPMVEHTRAHPRLKEESPPGRREKLELGTLFVPAEFSGTVLFFFHGGTWLPEVAAARNHMAVVSVQAGSGSGTYAKLFENPDRFLALLKEVETKVAFNRVLLGGWSAGCGAVRQILRSPSSSDRVAGVVLIDGIHTDYSDGKPGPLESKIGTENLDVWAQIGRDAIAGKKRVVITHSEIFPGTFASTTETADYLLKLLGVTRTAVLKWGPMGTQQLSEAQSGRFLLMGFAGNTAPDHVDQLHSLPDYLGLM
jgi:pimeloyl-ACP methyl ester carboxylesterase